jgi:hypothetical protein
VRLRKPVLLVLLAFVAVSCSNPGIKRGVRVDEVNTDVGLGVEPVLGAAPPNIVVRQPIPRRQLAPPTFATLPPFEIPSLEPSDCPAAGDFDFPEKDAGVDPPENVRPKEGAYRYHLDGKVVTDTGPVTLDQFETRLITEVQDDTAAPGAYNFKVTQTQLLDEREGGQIETTYRVVPRGNFQSVPNPGQGLPDVSDTGRGVYLVSIRFRGVDEENKPFESRFEPSNPLLLLPYPVVQGTEINASGTDPQTGSQVSITGVVKGKKQVDACGDRVDTWLIDAVETFRFSDPDTFQTETIEANYDYGVAPQFGGMILFEHIEAPIDGPFITVDARVGKVPEQSFDK